MIDCWHLWFSPGPCPVDEAPHTTCTSPDYDPKAPITVPIFGPNRRVVVRADGVLPPPFSKTAFTPATYRRTKR